MGGKLKVPRRWVGSEMEVGREVGCMGGWEGRCGLGGVGPTL